MVLNMGFENAHYTIKRTAVNVSRYFPNGPFDYRLQISEAHGH